MHFIAHSVISISDNSLTIPAMSFLENGLNWTISESLSYRCLNLFILDLAFDIPTKIIGTFVLS